MSALGDAGRNMGQYSTPLNVLPARHTAKMSRESEKVKDIEKEKNIKIDKINNGKEVQTSSSALGENGHDLRNGERGTFDVGQNIRHRIRSHEENNPRVYKHLLRKSKRYLLDKWMNEKLRQTNSLDDVDEIDDVIDDAVDDVNELDDPFDDVDVKGKVVVI